MNRITSFLAVFLLSTGALVSYGQANDEPKWLFDEEIEVTGGFISFTPRFTNVLGAYAALGAFNGGVTINDRLNVGLGFAMSGTTIKNAVYQEHLTSRTTADLDGLEFKYGYAGVLVEPVIRSRSVVHLKLPVLVGMGWCSYGYPAMSTNSSSDSNKRRIRTDGQAFLVIEPGALVEVSIIRSLRLGAGGSYIFTSDLELPATSADALRNFTLMFGLNWVIPNQESYLHYRR